MAKDERRGEVTDTFDHDQTAQNPSKSKAPVPNHCPRCDSEDVVYGSMTVEDGWMSQDADCLNCNYSWYDVYKLVEQEPIQQWLEDL